jgi:TonB family protein
MLFSLIAPTIVGAHLVAFPPAGLFERTPSGMAMAVVYPPRAQAQRKEGRVVLACTVTSSRTLSDCMVESETPNNSGFGPSALMLSYLFVVREGEELPADRKISFQVRFSLP